MASLARMPVRSQPIVGPATVPLPTPPPAPTPTGAFQAPVPGTLSAAGQFRLDQGAQARERSAAARGSLLSGGFQQELNRFAQGVASDEYDNDYRRALSTYETNRGTNQQNYGQSLAGYGANRDAFNDARGVATEQAGVINANAQAEDAYAQQMADYRASLEREGMAGGSAQPGGMALSARPLANRPIGSTFGGQMGDYRAQYPQLADAWRRRPEADQGVTQWRRNVLR